MITKAMALAASSGIAKAAKFALENTDIIEKCKDGIQASKAKYDIKKKIKQIEEKKELERGKIKEKKENVGEYLWDSHKKGKSAKKAVINRYLQKISDSYEVIDGYESEIEQLRGNVNGES
ncbi:MAG: hypothetical protein FWB74_04000 [Defluviitaleaceae bacterium]|nr:hypothetical protein [Defluviitaleaceae bacterium]